MRPEGKREIYGERKKQNITIDVLRVKERFTENETTQNITIDGHHTDETIMEYGVIYRKSISFWTDP